MRARSSRSAGPPRSGGRLVPIVATVGLAAALAGCGSGDAPAQAARGRGGPGGRPPKDPVPVAVEPIAVGVASSYYTATAVLEPESEAEVRSRTTGVVRRLLKEEGDTVEAGDLLMLLEDDEARVAVRQAELELDRIRTEHDRRVSMRAAGVLSDEELQTVESQLKKAEADLERARLQLAYTRIKAPFGGRVVRRHADLGAHVAPGTALFDLMDVIPLLARIHVPARRMGFIRPGQEIELHLESTGAELRGRVRLVSPIVDATSGTVKVTAEIDEYPDGTRPGDFARVRIVTARHPDALLARGRAVVEEKGKKYLFVVDGAKAVRRAVETGFTDGDDVEILSGVEAGATVVVKGQRGLKDGDPIEIVGDDDATTAAEPDRADAAPAAAAAG